MLKNRPALLMLLLLSAAIAASVLLTSHFTVKAVEAQSSANAKWEHCQVFEHTLGHASIEYYQATGSRSEPVRTERGIALSQAIAKLGEEGWEMAGLEAREGNRTIFYFKRLKR